MSSAPERQAEYVVEMLTETADDTRLPIATLEPVLLSALTSLASRMQRLPAGTTAAEFADTLWSNIDAHCAEGPTQVALFDLVP